MFSSATHAPKPEGAGQWTGGKATAQEQPEKLQALIAKWDRYAEEVGEVLSNQ